MRGLYAICDLELLDARGVAPSSYARALLAVRPAALQLRGKQAPAARLSSLASELGPVCREAGTALIINDRADVAAIAGADGVHVGQGDLTVDEVRGLHPQLAVGMSTHSLVQAQQALQHRPDYVAIGPVFATRSKRNPEPIIDPGLLRQVSQQVRAAGVPLVAIGGIGLEQVSALRDLVDAIAVIASLLPGPEVTVDTPAFWLQVSERAAALQRAFAGSS